ncbi:glycosyltransferase family 2 protein [Patescibacteria group bacterium]|nr:glycosyltransferase family 2 protein [Patescibacteria group bacterium]
MKLSLVIPAFNEEQRLGSFLASISSYAARHRNQLREILVVDDGSTDRTVAVAKSYQSRLPGLKILHHQKNQGKGAAVKTGVMAARGDTIVFIDADGATPITELPKMITALTQADIAVGNRYMPGAKTDRGSSLRSLSGWVYRTYMKLFGLGAIDTMCGFKGYQRQVARDLFNPLLESRWLFDTEIAYKSVRRGYRTKNFPIRWTSMAGSKLDTKTLIKSALLIWPLVQKIKKNEAQATSKT